MTWPLLKPRQPGQPAVEPNLWLDAAPVIVTAAQVDARIITTGQFLARD
jgi:hypothetical protein